MKYISKGKLEIKGNEITLKKPIVIKLYKEDAIGVSMVIVTVNNNKIDVVVEPRAIE